MFNVCFTDAGVGWGGGGVGWGGVVVAKDKRVQYLMTYNEILFG